MVPALTMDFAQRPRPEADPWEAPRRDVAAAPARAPMRGFAAHAGGPTAASPEEEARIADREKARTELAGQFQIVPDDHEGERVPNQVTQAEYERLCDNFSDIRTGSSNIKIDMGDLTGTDADTFRGFLLDDIASVLQTAGGRELIEQLATATSDEGDPRTTTIGRSGSALDARAGTADRTGEARENLYNGVGTDMDVHYRPGQDVGHPDMIDNWNNIRSDVVLFHELTHALHGVRGEQVDGLVPALEAGPGDLAPPGSAGVRLEEYATLGLGRFADDPRYAINENAYRAERRKLAGQPGERRGDDAWSMERRTNYRPTTAEDLALDEERRRRGEL